MLKQAGLAAVAAPMINRGRFRLFANSTTEYSRQAVDLIGRATVIDMLKHLGVGSDIDLYGYDAMPPDLNKQLRAVYKGQLRLS